MLTLLGVLAGLADYLLVQAARSYCEAGVDSDQLTALLFVHLPSRVALGALLGGGGYVLMRLFLLAFPAIRRSPHSRAVRTGVAGFVGLSAVIVMVLADFATVGTLADYPGNASLCGPENIPPWWPTWLPA